MVPPFNMSKLASVAWMKIYLLNEVNTKERNPPPVLAVLFRHVGEPPILSRTPLPLLSPEVVVGQSDGPNPCQNHHRHRPPLVIFRIRVICKEMYQQYGNHRPIQVNHLHNHHHRELKRIKFIGCLNVFRIYVCKTKQLCNLYKSFYNIFGCFKPDFVVMISST